MAQSKSIGRTNPVLDKFYDTLRKECIPGIENATVTLVAIQDEKIVHDRTGVLYRVGDHHFILTASHLGQDGENDLRAVIKYEIPYYVSVNKRGVLPIPLAGPTWVHGTEVDGRDIAVIQLPEDVATQIASHKRFISHNEVLVDDDDRTARYVVFGYPEDWSLRSVGDNDLCSDPLIFVAQQYTGQADPHSAYRPDVHLLLGFDRNAREVTRPQDVQLPKPYGISGCGVWRVAEGSNRGLDMVNKDDVKLVAVQNHWHPKRNYLMATRMGWVLERILDDNPELKRPMQLAYPRAVKTSRIIVPRSVRDRR